LPPLEKLFLLPRPGEVYFRPDLRYNGANEIAEGGAQWRRQALAGGVSEAGNPRCGALAAEAAVLPCPSPAD
jgi:hypothetical protein